MGGLKRIWTVKFKYLFRGIKTATALSDNLALKQDNNRDKPGSNPGHDTT